MVVDNGAVARACRLLLAWGPFVFDGGGVELRHQDRKPFASTGKEGSVSRWTAGSLQYGFGFPQMSTQIPQTASEWRASARPSSPGRTASFPSPGPGPASVKAARDGTHGLGFRVLGGGGMYGGGGGVGCLGFCYEC